MARPEGAMRHFFKEGHWPRYQDFSGWVYCLRCKNKGHPVRRVMVGVPL